QGAAVDLVQAGRALRAACEGEVETVALAPRVRPQEQSALAGEAAPEAAGRQEDGRLQVRRQGRLELHLACSPEEKPRQCAGFVAAYGRERVLGVLPDRLRRRRLEPAEPVVEPLPEQPLQPLVAAGALGAEALPLEVPPDHAGRKEHRAARACPFLQHAGLVSELAEA